MTFNEPTGNEPGWRIDPEDASQYRYWAGSSWTEHRSPRFQAASYEAPPASPQPSYAPTTPEAFTRPSVPGGPTADWTADPFASSGYAAPSALPEPIMYDQYGQVVPAAQPPRSRTWLWVTLAIVGVVIVAVIAVVAVMSIWQESTGPSMAGPVDTDAPVTGDPAFDDGTYLVGADIPSGVYRSTVVVDSFIDYGYCYWDVSEESGDWLAGDIGDFVSAGAADGLPTVALADGMTFTSDGCGDWVAVDIATLFDATDLETSMPSGAWLVGADIEPGTYLTDTQDFSDVEYAYCYWDIIDGIDEGWMQSSEGGWTAVRAATVTVDEGQQFVSEGCGDWTLQQ